MEIAKFTEQKLKEILHYTDQDFNPVFEAFKSNTFFELHSGAKGVSKSFGQAIITIYRIVNDIRFCSMWCRNQTNHIKKTLRPMFEKVLSFLKNEHGLDYTKCFSIYESGLYWEVDDGGLGRAIYFENFEKIQAFQGITLKNNNFLFGELVLDEPIEDPSDTKKQSHELEALYQLQEQKLPLLISNTVTRADAPEDYQIKVKFLYNIFTTDHWIIKNYHNQIIPIIQNGKLNQKIEQELLKNTYIQKMDDDFKNGLGISCTMYSKFFVPAKTLGDYQVKYLESLKQTDYRMWVITVLGFAFEDEQNKPNYFLLNYLFDKDNQLSKNIKVIKSLNEIDDKSIIGVYDGFDPGLSDKSAWCRTLLLESGEILVYEFMDDFGARLKKSTTLPRTAINNLLVNLINESNKHLETEYKDKFKTFNKSLLLTDNDIICESINILFNNQNINAIATLANRHDERKGYRFGIVNRQNWQKWIFSNQKIIFMNSTLNLVNYLAKQLILPTEEKRNEKIHPEIYDLVNSFEMSCSRAYLYQYMKAATVKKENNE